MKVKRWLAAGLAALLVSSTVVCAGEAENVSSGAAVIRMEAAGAGESLVAYPLFTGTGGALQINTDLFASARVGEYLAMLSTLSGRGTGLTVDYSIFPEMPGDLPARGVVSVVMSARGKMLEGRPSQVWYPLVYRLEDGSRLTAEDLYSDPVEAGNVIEAYLEENVEEGLSDYLENRELYPVPMDSFALCERGVVYYYSHDALCFLSGYSGEVLIPYRALEGVLREDSPASVFIPEGEERARKVFSCLEEGRLWGVPAALGEDLDGVLARLRCPFDASWWPGGACWETEDARMRGILLISMEGSGTVDAVLARGWDLCGLVCGETDSTLWRFILGEPDETGNIGPGDPLEAVLGTGGYDIYRRGGKLMLLHAGDDGRLESIMIANSQKGNFE